MPPKEADEGNGIGTQQINSEAVSVQIIRICFDFPSELVWSFSVTFPSSVSLRLPPSPEGKASVQYNCRGYNGHQGSALKRGNRGTVTPLQCQPHNLPIQTGHDSP